MEHLLHQQDYDVLGKALLFLGSSYAKEAFHPLYFLSVRMQWEDQVVVIR